MNQTKTGEFIAAIRREKNITQKQLAERLSISDKTVSKWENGRGFPDVSLLLPLCDALDVTVNELLSGERISEETYEEKAEENLIKALNNSSFSIKEKTSFYKKKWLKNHIALIVLEVLFWLGMVTAVGFLTNSCLTKNAAVIITGCFGGFLSTSIYLILYNKMMAYVEKNVYDGRGND